MLRAEHNKRTMVVDVEQRVVGSKKEKRRRQQSEPLPGTEFIPRSFDAPKPPAHTMPKPLGQTARQPGSQAQ